MVKINYNGEELRLVQSRYQDNSALYIGLADKDGEFCGDVTVNLPISGTLPSNCAFVDSNNLPTELIGKLLGAGIMVSICQSCRSGFCLYQAYRFTCLSDIDDILAVIK
jgi:hypothetical protein